MPLRLASHRRRVPKGPEWRSTQARTQTKEYTVQKNSPYDKPLQYSTGLKFAQMTRRQKYVFVTKLVACIATFGYAFPNVQNQ